MTIPTPRGPRVHPSRVREFSTASGPSGLFYERANDPYGPRVVYTLEDEDIVEPDGRIFKSLYRLYMEMGDITEYQFVKKYIGTWDQWDKLCKTIFFGSLIEQWRMELEKRIEYQALQNIMEEAMGEGKNAFIANKYLADKGWKKKPAKDKDTAPVGRPKKPAINQFEYDPASINADLKRLEALEQVHTNVQMDELSKRRSALTSTFVEEEIPTSVQ